MSDATLQDHVNEVLAMLKDDYDWSDSTSDVQEEFQACITLDVGDCNEFLEFGSYKPKDTTTSLYRLLYLCQPTAVDFSDMYKCRLFEFKSVDGLCVVSVELFKYELGIYFYAPQDKVVQQKQNYGVIAGRPGANNGWVCADDNINAFVAMVKTVIEHEIDVYLGNDFIV